IRDHLVKAHLDLLIAECVAIPVTRALTVAPGRLSLWSSIVKYFVPVVGEEVVASIGTVLAARGYLREGVAHGVFQKLQRDHAIASIFEGTTHVNLANVAGQLPYLIEPPEETGGEEELLADLFCWTRTPPHLGARRPQAPAHLRGTRRGRAAVGGDLRGTAGGGERACGPRRRGRAEGPAVQHRRAPRQGGRGHTGQRGRHGFRGGVGTGQAVLRAARDDVVRPDVAAQPARVRRRLRGRPVARAVPATPAAARAPRHRAVGGVPPFPGGRDVPLQRRAPLVLP